MKIWFRCFHEPGTRADFVVVPENVSIAELTHQLEERQLDDPANPGHFLNARRIEVWELNIYTKIKVDDNARWREVVGSCNGQLNTIATEVYAGNVDRLAARRLPEEYLKVVIAAKPPGLVSQPQDEGGTDPPVTFYPDRYQALMGYQISANTQTPARAADSAAYRKSQGQGFPIYDGRHPANADPTIALPVSLYHPVFQTFLEQAFDGTLTPPFETIAATGELMRRTSVLHPQETLRNLAVRGPLQDALRRGIDTVVNRDLSVPDGRISVDLTMKGVTRSVPLLIEEEKRNESSSTADASTQASFSMRRTWATSELDDFRNLACCPTFLLGFSGCHLVICGAVLTDKCIVNRLAMLWIGHSSILDEEDTLDNARVLHALSLAIDNLAAWYKALITSNTPIFSPGLTTHPRFFPFTTKYPVTGEDSDTGVTRFKYIRPLQPNHACTAFLAETVPTPSQGGKRIVVKFVERYCPDVHHLLAAKKMAPNLLYYGQINAIKRWSLVVMDFFDGEPSFVNNRDKDPSVYHRVVDIVQAAHDEGFVLGDVRPPNVLINEDEEIKMVDFDWSGREGEVRYPAHMSLGLWVEGVQSMGVIKKLHDTLMIDRWFHGE